MGIDDLRERIERLLGSERQHAGVYHDALLDLKLGLKDLKDAIQATARELESVKAELVTVERRGKLALDIGDQETVQIAATYADKHRQRAGVLERKLGVQQDELTMAEREYEELSIRYRSAKQGIPPEAGSADASEADPVLKARIDRHAAEKAVEAQLEQLKKKLGRQ